MSALTGTVDRPSAGQLDLEQFRELYRQVSTWNSGGLRPGRGGLDQLTPARVAAAATEVRTGRRVSLGLPLDLAAAPDNPAPPVHHMTGLADVPVGSGSLSFGTDYIGMNVHGDAHTHVDALCHVAYDGLLYDGVPAATLTSAGAGALAIDLAGARRVRPDVAQSAIEGDQQSFVSGCSGHDLRIRRTAEVLVDDGVDIVSGGDEHLAS
jgi:hypothetical protein